MANAREFLESILLSEKQLRFKSAQLQHLREKLTSLTAPTDSERVSCTKDVTSMARTIACVVDMEKELDNQTALLIERQNALFRMLDQLDPDDATYIMARFIDGKSNRAVSLARKVSIRQVNRRVAFSIARLQKIMEENEKKDKSA